MTVSVELTELRANPESRDDLHRAVRALDRFQPRQPAWHRPYYTRAADEAVERSFAVTFGEPAA